jgi:hypothetical protein
MESPFFFLFDKLAQTVEKKRREREKEKKEKEQDGIELVNMFSTRTVPIL